MDGSASTYRTCRTCGRSFREYGFVDECDRCEGKRVAAEEEMAREQHENKMTELDSEDRE